jgi:hypothetical protein
MRSTFGKQLRAVVLTLAFSTTFVPVAVAAPRDTARPWWQGAVIRIVKAVKIRLGGITTNADSLSIPRP